MQVIVGVDTHKASHTLVVLSENGKQLAQFVIKASPQGYQEALERVQALSWQVRWGIEGTYSFGQGLAQFLQSRGCEVYEVPGFVSKRHRRQSTHHGKSDPNDARAIAQAVLLDGERLSPYDYSDDHEAVRLLYESRDQLVRQRTQVVNRARAHAHFLGILDLPKDLTLQKSIESLREQLGEVKIIGAANGIRKQEIVECLNEIGRINERIAALEGQMRPFVDKLASTLLELRGVSTIAAAGIVGHTGSLRNCRNAQAFAMHTGVAPVPCSSGQHTAMRLNRGGNRQLNRLLHGIAITQLRSSDHEGRLYYDRKRAEGKAHKAALRSLKRQLATVVYYRLRTSQQNTDRAYASAA